MQQSFPLFNRHLELAHFWWNRLLKVGDTVLDATTGNGHDTLFLALRVLNQTSGTVWGFDIQKKAIDITREKLLNAFGTECMDRIHLLQQSHHELPEELLMCRLKLAVYNLGYLPGGSKNIITQVETTIDSLQKVLLLIQPGGVISITCYSGHPNGGDEQKKVLEWASGLPKAEWRVCLHQWINTLAGPALLLVQRRSEELNAENSLIATH